MFGTYHIDIDINNNLMNTNTVGYKIDKPFDTEHHVTPDINLLNSESYLLNTSKKNDIDLDANDKLSYS